MSENAPLKDSRVAPATEAQPYTVPKHAPPQGSLFAQVNELRTVDRRPLDDESLKYKDTFFGRLAGNKKFEMLTFFFIGINSLYIGADADYNARTGKPADLYDSNTPVVFQICENIFCVYFTLEVAIRFIGYRRKRDSLTDAWFVFDFTLVTLMVLETWIFPIFGIGGQLAQFAVLRLLRLLRISRMARLMKKVPELMIIIKGMVASFRSVGCTAILQVLILYVWSILFVSEYHEKGVDDPSTIAEFFGTMGKSMFTLFIMGTVLDDVTQSTNAIRETGNMFMLSLFVVFIVISSFTILNMLIGILCEVVSATAESEKTKTAESSVKEAITEIFDTIDLDQSGTITEKEFITMRDDPKVKSALEEMDIYQSQFARYCEILFKNQELPEGKTPTINFDTLIAVLMRLSPNNHINALDFSLFQASIDKTQESLRDRVLRIHGMISTQIKQSGSAVPSGAEERPPSSGSIGFGDAGANASAAQTRRTAQGDAPPQPPRRGVEDYTKDMFVKISSHEIIKELERRLEVSDVVACKKDRPADQPMEVFHSLGVPDLPPILGQLC